MALDVRKLGVTLRSTSGTMAYAEEIYDESQGKFQSAINKELAQSIGAVNIPVKSVKAGDKALALTGTELSTTLGLTYTTGKKIALTGIGGAEIASIDVADFIKDKVVSSAELVETAEAGVEVAVPYIKLVFNDASTPIRFSVKSLVDVYTGANLKLSDNYATTTAVAPANGVSVDASIKNLATRMGTAEGKTYVDSLGGKKGAITLASGSTTSGAVNFTIGTDNKLSATVVDTAYAKSADVADAYATKTELAEAQKTLKASVDGNATAIEGLRTDVDANTAEIANALNEISKGTDGNFVTTTVGTKSSKKQTIGVSIKTQSVSTASSSADGVATANDVKTYVGNEVATINDNAYQGIEKGTDGAYVTTSVSAKASNKQKVSVAVTTHTVSSASSTANGLATAYDVKQNCIMASVASDVEYDDWEAIVGGTTSTTTAKA